MCKNEQKKKRKRNCLKSDGVYVEWKHVPTSNTSGHRDSDWTVVGDAKYQSVEFKTNNPKSGTQKAAQTQASGSTIAQVTAEKNITV